MKTCFNKIGISILSVVMSGLLLSTVRAGSSTLWGNLSEAQQDVVRSGKQLLITEVLPNAIWPRFHIYCFIPASPRDVEAAFWDVKDDPHYVPDCTKVTINSRPARNIVDATYYLNVPFLPQEVSQVRTEVVSLSSGGYNNTWNVLSSTYSQSGTGSFLIVPHQDGSLVCYTNFVVPKSSIASLLRGQAERQLRQTVKAIAERAEYQMKQDPSHHAVQLEELDHALGGKVEK